jgi:L-cysteine desulfidase
VIAQSIVNSIGCIGGMVCDGAKSSCADKIAVALQCAFLGYDLACAGAGFQNGEGIVKDGVEETIDSVGRMARRGMQETNHEILEIMMD